MLSALVDTPNFALIVAMVRGGHFPERPALPALDRSTEAVLLFPHNG